MADIHVLDGGEQTWNVVMHFVVPNQNNAVGVNYHTALVNSGLGGGTAMAEGNGPGQITAAEKTLIQAGELYEHRFVFRVEGNGADAAAVRASLRQSYAREASLVLAGLQNRLKYYGHTESQI